MPINLTKWFKKALPQQQEPKGAASVSVSAESLLQPAVNSSTAARRSSTSNTASVSHTTANNTSSKQGGKGEEQQPEKGKSRAEGKPIQQQNGEAASKPPAPSSKPTPAELLAQFTNELRSGDVNRYRIKEVIGKGSYGVVCSAEDLFTGEKVAIKKITNIFEHVSDATRILREIKLLRLLKHPDVVEIKHICLPPSARDFKDIYVVFELMETDLHQVIKANDDLTPDHHQFFLYQMLRGLKYIHSAKVYHRDLKPKNILANSDCKLKICDFGLARPAFENIPNTVFWTDYVATRWYRAPELCGSFYAKYTAAIDVWSVGCMFAEVLLGKPLFPGKNVVHQLELITDLLGTPPPEVVMKVRNEKARRFLSNMKAKPGIPFEQFFPMADVGALSILKKLLAFDPSDRPTAEEALSHPYFSGLHLDAREPVTQPVSKLAFQFDRVKVSMEDVRQLIYQEILEYHPHVNTKMTSSFQNPSALDNFKRQFFQLEQNPGTVLDSSNAGSQPSSLPKGLVSCTSNPREMGTADMELHGSASNVLVSQESAPCNAHYPLAPPTSNGIHKAPQLDQEELDLLMMLENNSIGQNKPASPPPASHPPPAASKTSMHASKPSVPSADSSSQQLGYMLSEASCQVVDASSCSSTHSSTSGPTQTHIQRGGSKCDVSAPPTSKLTQDWAKHKAREAANQQAYAN